jgi:hypothetical protein
MSKFTDRLWREIVHEHGAELAQLAAPEGKQSRRARPRVVAGTSLALAGICAAAVLLLSAAGGSPAYAVTRNHDGTVSVALRQLSAIPQLNAKLAALDVRAQVVPILSGCNASVVRMKLLRKGGRLDSNQVIRFTRVAGARFDPRAIPRGKLLVIAAWKRGQHVYTGPQKTVAGVAAPACLPVPAPAALCAKAIARGQLSAPRSLSPAMRAKLRHLIATVKRMAKNPKLRGHVIVMHNGPATVRVLPRPLAKARALLRAVLVPPASALPPVKVPAPSAGAPMPKRGAGAPQAPVPPKFAPVCPGPAPAPTPHGSSR